MQFRGSNLNLKKKKESLKYASDACKSNKDVRRSCSFFFFFTIIILINTKNLLFSMALQVFWNKSCIVGIFNSVFFYNFSINVSLNVAKMPKKYPHYFCCQNQVFIHTNVTNLPSLKDWSRWKNKMTRIQSSRAFVLLFVLTLRTKTISHQSSCPVFMSMLGWLFFCNASILHLYCEFKFNDFDTIKCQAKTKSIQLHVSAFYINYCFVERTYKITVTPFNAKIRK